MRIVGQDDGRDVPLLSDTEAGWDETDALNGNNSILLHLHEEVTLEELPLQSPKSSVLDSAWNLCNTTLGAGLYALPHVFAALGLLGGSLSIMAAGIFTYYSIDAMLRTSEKYRKSTYAGCLEVLWGKWAATAVHVTVIACCGGFIVLYIIITCDVIVGNSEFTGILNDLFPGLSDPLPWYLSRTALITWITLAAAPLLSAKTLHGMALTSAISVGASVVSMLALLLLAVIAAYQGKLAKVHWLPDASLFGSNAASIAAHMLATLPVVMSAFSSQMSIHPILQDLDNYTPKRMRWVVGSSFSVCTVTYALAGCGGYLVFGRDVEGDVLASIQPESVAQFFGNNGSIGLAYVTATKLCVAVAMLTSLPINLWPMRSDILDLMEHWIGTSVEGHHPPAPSAAAFYTVTYGCLAVIYTVAIRVKTMWEMIQLVGGTCCIFLAFIFPGMLALRLEDGGRGEVERKVTGRKVFGGVLIVVGLVLMVAGVASAVSLIPH